MGIPLEKLKAAGLSVGDNATVFRIKSLQAAQRRKPKAPPVPRGESALEQKFDRLWKANGGPDLEKEYQFHESRKWRFDRALRLNKIAFELHGGVFSGGRHTRGRGFEKDREKMNQAALSGWKVFELTGSMLTDEFISKLIETCRQ